MRNRRRLFTADSSGDKLILSPRAPPSPFGAFIGADKCAQCLPWRTAMRIESGCEEKEESALIKCNIMTPECTATMTVPPPASTLRAREPVRRRTRAPARNKAQRGSELSASDITADGEWHCVNALGQT